MKASIRAMTAVLALGLAGPSLAGALTLSPPTVAKYTCTGGKKIVASYYQLSDQSLSFVRLSASGKTYTIPEAMAASGARYANDTAGEWWEHHGEATLTLAGGKAKALQCRQVK